VTRLEFPVDTTAFIQAAHQPAAAHAFVAGGNQIRFRLPTSRDLAEVVAAPDATQGLRRLVARCVIAMDGDAATVPRDMPPELVESLSRAMLDADPRPEITLALNCPECGHAWHMPFDIADFFWVEVSALAKRLLREIDVIARAYGWSEAEILRLPARRRQSYLELIES
jgi:hypothetical protein